MDYYFNLSPCYYYKIVGKWRQSQPKISVFPLHRRMTFRFLGSGSRHVFVFTGYHFFHFFRNSMIFWHHKSNIYVVQNPKSNETLFLMVRKLQETSFNHLSLLILPKLVNFNFKEIMHLVASVCRFVCLSVCAQSSQVDDEEFEDH